MMIFMSYAFGVSMQELAPSICEFPTFNELKKYLSSQLNIKSENIFLSSYTYNEDRLGWEDVRTIFYAPENIILGSCTTKYKSLISTLKRLIPSDKEDLEYLEREFKYDDGPSNEICKKLIKNAIKKSKKT